MIKVLQRIALLTLTVLGLQACFFGGGGGGDGGGGSDPATNVGAPGGAQAVPGGQNLTVANVNQILGQAIAEAQARSVLATIAVVDRVGNVLGVVRMTGAATTTTIVGPAGTGGLNGVVVPDSLAAIAKAVTGAYLSSLGNGFTTRTANQIVQEHFNPGETLAVGGPLFGVQFSQLPCSDLNIRFIGGGAPQDFIGPKRSPLGLSADPGGLPLYKNGDMVGGIGVISDGAYGLDVMITDIDTDNDELIALAGTVGFDVPTDIRASRITVVGKSLRYTDRGTGSLMSDPTTAAAFVNGTGGSLLTVVGYSDGAVVRGRIFGNAESGYRADAGTFTGLAATPFVLVDGTNTPRFPPIAGNALGGNQLTAAEVTTIIENALTVAFRARAQIRRPLNSHAQVTVSVVDHLGQILGIARTPDGPIFGTDVSLQKARTAVLFSSTDAATQLTNSDPARDVFAPTVASFVTAAQAFVGPTALTDGIAFADRSGGNLSRPFYPDGVDNTANGPFSQPFAVWSPFNVGLQLNLVALNLVEHLGFVQSLNADTANFCTGLPVSGVTGSTRAANGIQIFPGSVPIFRGNTLIGGVGVSGDGVDQDDMISFLGLHNAGIELGTGVGNAPTNIRADTLTPQGSRLRYVNCPFSPFIDSDEQNVCAGK